MRARLATGLLALCVGATACSGGGGGEVTAPTLPPITEAPSPSPTAEPVPSEATEATPEGAAEFGRYFYESIDRAFQERDASILRAISSQACEICQRYIASVERLSERDERVEGNDINVKDVVSPGDPGETTTVTVSYDNTAARRLDSSGNLLREEPARVDVLAELVLARTGGSWLVEEVRAG